jgi:hypothetical protein
VKVNELAAYLASQGEMFGGAEVLLLPDGGALVPFNLSHLVFAGATEWGGCPLMAVAKANAA